MSVSTAVGLRGGPRASGILSVEACWKCKFSDKNKVSGSNPVSLNETQRVDLSNQCVKESSGHSVFPGDSDASRSLRATGLQGQNPPA